MSYPETSPHGSEYAKRFYETLSPVDEASFQGAVVTLTDGDGNKNTYMPEQYTGLRSVELERLVAASGQQAEQPVDVFSEPTGKLWAVFQDPTSRDENQLHRLIEIGRDTSSGQLVFIQDSLVSGSAYSPIPLNYEWVSYNNTHEQDPRKKRVVFAAIGALAVTITGTVFYLGSPSSTPAAAGDRPAAAISAMPTPSATPPSPEPTPYTTVEPTITATATPTPEAPSPSITAIPEPSPTPVPTQEAATPPPSPEPTPESEPQPIVTSFNVATWNMYYKNKKDMTKVVNILTKDVDILLLQEAGRHNEDLAKVACKTCGYGRVQLTTSQRRNVILYNKERFELKDSYDLHAATDPPNHKRYIVVALLVDKKTGQEFYAVSTHAPYRVDGGGVPSDSKSKNVKGAVKAYEKFMDKLTDEIKKLQKQGKPILVGGDFNVAKASDSKKCKTVFFPCNAITKSLLNDAYDTTRADEEGATHGRTRDIDYLFYGSPDKNNDDNLVVEMSNVVIVSDAADGSGNKGSDHSMLKGTVNITLKP